MSGVIDGCWRHRDMPEMCAKLSVPIQKMVVAQRAFWDAWKAVQAGDRTRFGEAYRTRNELEAKFKAVRRTLYQAWFMRDLPSVVAKEEYACVGGVDASGIGRPTALHVSADGTIYTFEKSLAWEHQVLWRSSARDNTVDLRGYFGGKSIATFAVTPDDRVIVATELDDEADADSVVYQLTRQSDGTYERENLFEHGFPFYHIQPFYDGRILTGDVLGNIYLWSEKSKGNWERLLVGQREDELSCMQMMEDGSILSGWMDGEVILWKPREDGDGYSKTRAGKHGDCVTCVQGRPDGSIISGGEDGLLVLATPHSDDSFEYDIRNLLGGYPVTCLQYLPDDRVVVGFDDGDIVMVSNVDGSLQGLESIGKHHWPPDPEHLEWGGRSDRLCRVNDLQVTQDGRIYSVGDDDQLRIWDGRPS